MEFKELMNSHHKHKAYVLGKGPSLAGWERPDDSVVIGVNDVGNFHPVDYSVTTDGFKPGVLGAAKIARLTALPNRGGMDHDKTTEMWFLHCDDLRRDGYACRFDRETIARTRWLYTCSGSAQPAIHLAWYLGCTELELVGIDGGKGYAKGMVDHADDQYNHPDRFTHMLADTLRVANFCFGKRWTRRCADG